MSVKMHVVARRSAQSPTGWVYFQRWAPLDGEDDEPEIMPATTWFSEDAARMSRRMAENVADRVRRWFPGYAALHAPD